MIEALEPHEIVVVECQVAVVGRAQGRSDIIGFIALQSVAGPRDIDRHGQDATDDEQDETDDERTEMARRGLGVGHAEVPEVRNDKSARSTPRR